jgi:hypothetical protein
MLFLIIARVAAIFVCVREKLCGQKECSDSKTSFEGSDSTSGVGANMSVKEDIMPN